jgi:hypothetical protein
MNLAHIQISKMPVTTRQPMGNKANVTKDRSEK